MKPLFTIHGGEYLVGSYIEQQFKRVNLWVPSKDTGIDLLVTDRQNRRSVSLQVKFGKDWLVTDGKREFQDPLRACGWWTINRDKLGASTADFWVFVMLGSKSRTPEFIVIPPAELRKRLTSIHGAKKMIHSYIWVTEHKRCWETRGLPVESQLQIAYGKYQNASRDLRKWLNNWAPVSHLNR